MTVAVDDVDDYLAPNQSLSACAAASFPSFPCFALTLPSLTPLPPGATRKFLRTFFVWLRFQCNLCFYAVRHVALFICFCFLLQSYLPTYSRMYTLSPAPSGHLTLSRCMQHSYSYVGGNIINHKRLSTKVECIFHWKSMENDYELFSSSYVGLFQKENEISNA